MISKIATLQDYCPAQAYFRKGKQQAAKLATKTFGTVLTRRGECHTPTG